MTSRRAGPHRSAPRARRTPSTLATAIPANCPWRSRWTVIRPTPGRWSASATAWSEPNPHSRARSRASRTGPFRHCSSTRHSMRSVQVGSVGTAAWGGSTIAAERSVGRGTRDETMTGLADGGARARPRRGKAGREDTPFYRRSSDPNAPAAPVVCSCREHRARRPEMCRRIIRPGPEHAARFRPGPAHPRSSDGNPEHPVW